MAHLQASTLSSMAPTTRLEEKLRKLGLSHDDAGSSHSSSASKLKHSFRIYFPLPPYDGLQFNALRSGPGFNFTGQLLGIGGKQLQRIKQESSARVEVVNAQGNLNGAHPDPLDPELHALITADSMGKLQKAADMVWDLLQPVNARYQPIEVTPGGSIRLTVMQAKRTGKCSKSTTPTAAASHTAGKPQSGGASQPAPAAPEGPPSPSLTVSPAVTPVTPAATAVPNAAFTARRSSHSSSCSQSCTSPPVGRSSSTHESTNNSNISRSNSFTRTNSSIQVALFTRPDDDFVLPPAAVPSSAPHPAARGVSQDPTPGLVTSKIKNMGDSMEQAEGQQAGAASDLQPPTPHAEQAVAAPAASSGAAQSAFTTDPGIAFTKGPLAALKVEQQQQPWSPAMGPEGSNSGSCSSIFQYGLGLCNSSSWDSPLSCGSKESPALQALIVDHQRQQQLEQLQLMQAGLGGQPLTPVGFSDANIVPQYSSSAVGSFPEDGFNLGLSAVLPATAVTSGNCSTLPPPMECIMQSLDSRHLLQGPANGYQQLHYHEQQSVLAAAAARRRAIGEFAAPDPGQGVEQVAPGTENKAGMGWGLHTASAGAMPAHAIGAYDLNGTYAGMDPVCWQSPWPLTQQDVRDQQGMMFAQQQQHCMGPWGRACGVFASTHDDIGSYDQAHALSSSIW